MVCHRMETVFFLNRNNSNFLGNRALVGIDEEDFLIVRKEGSKLWDQLVNHDGVDRMAEFVQSVLIRLEDAQIHLLAYDIEDIKGYPIIPAIRISIPNDQNLVFHSV